MSRRRVKKIEKFDFRMQAKLLLAFGIITVVLIVMIILIIKINVKDGSRYAKRVLSQQSYTSSEVAYKRGDILDSNGIILATSVKIYNLVIDPKFVLTQVNDEYLYKDAVVDVLTDFFEMKKEDVLSLLEEKKEARYVILQKKVDTELVNKYEEYVDKYEEENKAILKGLWFEEQYERQYPLSTVASSVIGFTYDTNAGSFGIEEKYNDELNGIEGHSFGYYDSELNLQRSVKKATNGNSIVTTINSNIQQIVEKHINKFQEETGSKNASIIIADPDNGEIIAMASSSGIYDLNNPRDLSKWYTKEEISAMNDDETIEALTAVWKNTCISDSYEPGSTVKAMVLAAAMEEGIITGDEVMLCDGKEVVAEKTKPIKCSKREGHGMITIEESLMYSCNDVLMAVGGKMGRSLFSKYQSRFGFGQKTGIDLIGEAAGITYKEEQLNPVELATSSFGQGYNVTMIQLVAAFSSVINGGYYYEPHVVKQILNDNGAVIEEVEPVVKKQIISNDVSKKLVKYLQSTVEAGTAKTAQVEGYTIGGKTGTAQKLPRGNGKYLVSFIGFAPCDNPEFVIYATVDEPNVDNQAQSSIAQGLAQGIMKEIFPFMGVYSSIKTEEKVEETKEPAATKEPEDDGRLTTEELLDEESYDYGTLDDENTEDAQNILPSEEPEDVEIEDNETARSSGAENSLNNDSRSLEVENSLNNDTNSDTEESNAEEVNDIE